MYLTSSAAQRSLFLNTGIFDFRRTKLKIITNFVQQSTYVTKIIGLDWYIWTDYKRINVTLSCGDYTVTLKCVIFDFIMLLLHYDQEDIVTVENNFWWRLRSINCIILMCCTLCLKLWPLPEATTKCFIACFFLLSNW